MGGAVSREGRACSCGREARHASAHENAQETEHAGKDARDRADDRAHERGAGTVLVLGIAAVVLLLGLAVAALGAAQQARGTAQASADLGALAAATSLRAGFDPCVTARATVERNHGRLVECHAEEGGVVAVTVRRASAGLPGWGTRDALARSRAGPRPAAPLDGG